MLQRIAFVIAFGLLLSSNPARSEAAGETQASAERAPLVVYLILKPEESENTMLVERYHLPSSLSALAWSQFSVQAGGNVELQAIGGYRLLSHKPVSVESLGGYGVYGYEVQGTWSGVPGPKPKSVYSIDFDYSDLGDDRGVVVQPSQRPLLEAIRRSGKAGGMARILKLNYLGQGRFRARVGIR